MIFEKNIFKHLKTAERKAGEICIFFASAFGGAVLVVQ
jgi:hypothetical protein